MSHSCFTAKTCTRHDLVFATRSDRLSDGPGLFETNSLPGLNRAESSISCAMPFTLETQRNRFVVDCKRVDSLGKFSECANLNFELINTFFKKFARFPNRNTHHVGGVSAPCYALHFLKERINSLSGMMTTGTDCTTLSSVLSKSDFSHH